MAAIQDQNTLAFIESLRVKAVEAAKQATAWRIEGTLREFPKLKPVNAWFKYPIHELDESLADISLEEEQSKIWQKNTKKANNSRSVKTQQELEEAFNILSEGGEPVEAVVLADYLDISRSAVYKRVKKHDSFDAVDGIVTKKVINEFVTSSESNKK